MRRRGRRDRRPHLDGCRPLPRCFAGERALRQLDNTAEVETPELVRFRYRVAGPVRRSAAYLIDLLIRIAILVLLRVVASLALGTADKASTGVILLAAFLLEWGYYVAFETMQDGRSPGKRALSLRVVKEGGFSIGFIDSVLRNLLRGADFLPVGYVLGVVVMAGDARFRRIGDHVAGTLVVVEERARVAAPVVLDPAPTPDELARLPARPQLSASEREALDLFMRRADLLKIRRIELAETVAPALARRLGVTFADPVRFLGLLHHRTAPATPARRGR
jgi:uncharacterized RDD family membrane protein YckC